MPAPRGRFAPSPTGPLHLGSLTAALGSWLMARHAGGEWLVRVEDLDPPREKPGAARLQLETLAAFGLLPDAPVLFQSQRGDHYATALAPVPTHNAKNVPTLGNGQGACRRLARHGVCVGPVVVAGRRGC